MTAEDRMGGARGAVVGGPAVAVLGAVVLALGSCGDIESAGEADGGGPGADPDARAQGGGDAGAQGDPDAGEAADAGGEAFDAATPPDAGPADPLWREVTPGGQEPSPGPRQHATMAYDAARERVILFGGRDDNNDRRGDTWAWDGEGWTDVTPTSPSPSGRERAAMAYDAARERIVLFSGLDESGSRPRDTWEWDGFAWHDVTPPDDADSPPQRLDHAMAYDPGRQRVVLFGGRSSSSSSIRALGDTWEWDGEVWSEVTISGEDNTPGDRWGHAMAYSHARELPTSFAGHHEDLSFQGDTWEFNGFTWVEIEPIGGRRRNHAVAADARRGHVVVFGGYDGSSDRLGDTRRWDGESSTILTDELPEAPEPRSGHVMAYDGARDQIVLFGGTTDALDELGDTWVFYGGRVN